MYIQYLKYLARHKWYVAVELAKIGSLGLAITHDLNKFRFMQIKRYANFFYNKKVRDSTGYYKPTDTGDDEFEKAWFSHQSNSKHHFQYWNVITEDGTFKCMEMPEIYVDEMICDWVGAGKAQGTPDTYAWYRANKDKMYLHKNTRRLLEFKLKRRAMLKGSTYSEAANLIGE